MVPGHRQNVLFALIKIIVKFSVQIFIFNPTLYSPVTNQHLITGWLCMAVLLQYNDQFYLLANITLY